MAPLDSCRAGSSQVPKCCQLFRAFRGSALCARGMARPYFSVGPPRQWECTHACCLGGLALLENHGESSVWRRRPHIATASSRIIFREESGCSPSSRRSRPSLNRDPILRVKHYTFDGVGELYLRRSLFCDTVTLYRPSTHHNWGRAGMAGSRFVRDDKEPEPQRGLKEAGERPR